MKRCGSQQSRYGRCLPSLDLENKDPLLGRGIDKPRWSRRGHKLNPKYLGWACTWKIVACNVAVSRRNHLSTWKVESRTRSLVVNGSSIVVLFTSLLFHAVMFCFTCICTSCFTCICVQLLVSHFLLFQFICTWLCLFKQSKFIN